MVQWGCGTPLLCHGRDDDGDDDDDVTSAVLEFSGFYSVICETNEFSAVSTKKI